MHPPVNQKKSCALILPYKGESPGKTGQVDPFLGYIGNCAEAKLNAVFPKELT